MLPAKLFAGLSAASSICAALFWLFASRSPEALASAAHISVGGSVFFAVGPMLVPLFCALTCANYAVLYFAAVRIFHAKWNHTLSIFHFVLSVCFAVSGSLVYPLTAHSGSSSADGGAFRSAFLLVLLALFSFATSFLLFALNLTLIARQIVRAHFATR